MASLTLVDSSGWLEFLADGPDADEFARAVEDPDRLVVPTICIAEVFKRIMIQRGKAVAMEVRTVMERGRVVDLTADLAEEAAHVGVERCLALADSIILATARALDAEVLTQDADFKGIPGVRYFPKRRGGR